MYMHTQSHYFEGTQWWVDESVSPWSGSSTGRKTESCPLTATSSHTSLTMSVTVVLLETERERENSHCVTMRINSLNRIVVSSSVLCPELVSDKTRNMTETSVHISQCQSLHPYARKNSQWVRMRIKSLNRIVVSLYFVPNWSRTKHGI